MRKNSFVEGTIVAYIAILITKMLGIIYVIPFYKIIGSNGGVLYSYAYNIYNLFLNISTSGIPTAVSIIISEYNALNLIKERELTYKTANKVIFFISFFAFLIMFIFAKSLALFFIGNIEGANSIQNVVMVIRVISFCLLVIPFLSVTRGYLQGNKYVSVSSFSQLIEQVVRIIVMLIGSYVVINLLHYDIPFGVAVSLTGAVIGGLVALIFLKLRIKKNKKDFEENKTPKSISITKKDIIKKIIKYAIPIVIISVTQNIYEAIDLKFIIKGLYIVGYKASKCEMIGSLVVTWAPKICMIINALAIGLCSSIIPFIVEKFVKKDYQGVNDKFNQAINTIIYVGVPLSIFIILFSTQIFNAFYGKNYFGPKILVANAVVSIVFCIQMVINIILQGMKKYKIIYINTFTGIIINALLDLPIIILLGKINFYPYLGSLMATLIGQIISITIVLIKLKKEYSFKYNPILKNIFKIILPTIGMILILLILKIIIQESNSTLINFVKLGICGLISITIYISISYKNNSLQNIFGKDFMKKLLIKLKIKKEKKYE